MIFEPLIATVPLHAKRSFKINLTQLIIYYLFFSVFLFLSCSETENPSYPNEQQRHFGIYFLKDSLLTEKDVKDVPIENLVLDDVPWISDDDIEFYDFSSHCIYLKKDKSYYLNYYKGVYKPLKLHLINKPFVVTAGSKKCYIGALHSLLLSSFPVGPYIDDFSFYSYYPSDVLHIESDIQNEHDTRNDSEVKECLIKNNKYHAGLEFELKDIKLIENSDISTLEYSIKITNIDTDDLMVIDPDKMGSGLFHYFTNGPVLKNENHWGYYESSQKVVTSPEPYNSWDYNWFTLVKSKQSIERTIRLKGYPYLPYNRFKCFMSFANPATIPKNNRNINGTRIWIGKTTSKTIEVVF